MRTTPLLLVALCLVAAPSCTLYYNIGKFTGLITPREFDPNKEVPEDFKLSIDIRDWVEPPTDYVLSYSRNGQAAYDITVRSPRRKHAEGAFEITEDQVRALWKAVATARFDKLDERYPDEGEGFHKKYGVQKYYVFADNTERRVSSHFQSNDALESVRRAAVGVAPAFIWELKANPGTSEAPKEYIADVATSLFHLPDCPRLTDVPPANRQPFATQWDAVNYKFKPCPECQPMKTSK
jgi:hypothetical protein